MTVCADVKYGHHGSKAAGNMIGRLLSYDLKQKGVSVAMIHVSYLQVSDMTDAAQPGFLKTGAFSRRRLRPR